jgi:hypothetical protein
MNCSTCGGSLAPSDARCGICGANVSGSSIPPSVAARRAPTQLPLPVSEVRRSADTPLAANVQPHIVQQRSVVVNSGGACPRCYTVGVSSNRYTIWHWLVAICWFPIGLLIFLAPVRRCVCGNEFGLGLIFVRIGQTLLAIFAFCAILVYAALQAGHR